MLKRSFFKTPLGEMIAIADETALYLLEFNDRKNLSVEITRLEKEKKQLISEGMTEPLISIQREIREYFSGARDVFETPIAFVGTPFQQQVWHALRKINFGETKSYAEVAEMLGKTLAFRAVARANSTNQLAIIVPCHRVVYANGGLGGYAAGVARKERLLAHEKGKRENDKHAIQYRLTTSTTGSFSSNYFTRE